MRPIIVVEAGINAEGSLERAFRMICLAKTMGADYIKFQVKDVDQSYPKEYLDKPKDTEFGTTIRDEKIALEWTPDDLEEIDAFCKRQDIKWFATPRDADSAEMLMRFDPPFLKIASGSIPDKDLVEFTCKTKKPTIMSVGMAYASEVESCVRYFENNNGNLQYILHAVLEYPTPDDKMNMNRLHTLRRLYGDRYKIGFSNHSKKLVYIVQAISMGAEMVEFHFTEDRNLPGVDQKASIGPTGFKRIMDHVASIESGWGDGSICPSDVELSKGAHWLWRMGDGNQC
jgi:sialic acid synthase SpsE